jgi:hypothetical protein
MEEQLDYFLQYIFVFQEEKEVPLELSDTSCSTHFDENKYKQNKKIKLS